MLETKDLVMDKVRQSDWKAMYKNVWSQEESAKHMLWSVTVGEENARARMQRTIDFQKTHDTYLVYEKAAGEAIGFAGVEMTDAETCREMGICLGPRFVRKGYGRQILSRLMQYGREDLGAKWFVCSFREKNQASKGLALSLGFAPLDREERVDTRNNQPYILLTYRIQL